MPTLPWIEEVARLQELHCYQVLDTEPEVAFERIVSLAQRSFKVPIVSISLVDENRQWFKASLGLEVRETDLESSFCAQAIKHSGVMVILDATKDVRFRSMSSVTGAPFVRFYAGAPLTTPQGYTLGTLCLIDSVPHHDFSVEARDTLADLAAVVVDELELRRANQEIQQQATLLHVRNHALGSLSAGVAIADATQPDFPLIDLNPAFEQLTGYTREEVLGQNCRFLNGPETDPATRQEIRTALREKRGCQVLIKNYRKDATTFWNELTLSPVVESAGLVSHYIGIQVDVTERKRAEAQLAIQMAALKTAEHKAKLQADFRHNLLNFVQQTLQEELTDDDFYQALLERAVRMIPGTQAGSILIRRNDTYPFVAAVGFDLELLRSFSFTEKDFLRGNPRFQKPQLVYGWEAELLNDTQREIMEVGGRAKDIAVSLCVPIVVEGQVVVSLNLDNFDDRDAFGDEALEMARVLAQQVAALLQRKKLEATLREKQTELERLAHYDSVTGLPNRRLFDDRLEQAAAQSRRSGRPLTVMFLDLDNFKHVNDTYGHSVGDELIKEVAAHLACAIREGDTLARWGGDEFAIILPNLGDICEASTIAERLLDALRQPLLLNGREVRIGASIGIDVCLDGLTAAAELVKNADVALYRAKTNRGSYQFSNEHMREKLKVRIELGDELRTALEKDALTLYYQPRINLATGQIVSLEALARWQHPTKGWIPPSTFIPLAEELGLIRQLGARMLDKACAQVKTWEKANLAYRVAVNLSVEQLKTPTIVEDVSSTLRRHALDATLLELEITESAAMIDVEESITKLQQFRDMGVKLAIDDFGTAYSSLAYLNRLPVDTLKIDRSFIKDMAVDGVTGSNGEAIVQTILALGKNLMLGVVAEGVETETQYEALKRFGCDEAQGYLFAAPLNATAIEPLLERGVLTDTFNLAAAEPLT